MAAPEMPWKEHVKAMKASTSNSVPVDLHEEFPKVLDTVEELKQEKVEAAEEKRRGRTVRRGTRDEEQVSVLERPSVMALDAPSGRTPEPDGGSKVRRKKKKKEDVNVFQDFGKEHDDAPVQEVKVNGMVFYKLNYERYWQNERDLQRWGESLRHNIRYERMLYKVRDRWHEDLLGDRLELKISHNCLVRSRSQRYRPRATSSAHQLKDLQKMIAPKENKKKKVMAELASKSGGSGLFGSFFAGDDGAAKDEFAKEESQQEIREEPLEFGEALPDIREEDEEMEVDDVSAPRSEPGDEERQSASACSSRRRSGQLEEEQQEDLNQRFRDFMEMEMEQVRQPVEVAQRSQMPTTMALLLFRNADRNHGGETLFVKRWPPAGGLKELLHLAGEAGSAVSSRPLELSMTFT
ncbi:unnamed protein product [Durusdinium trenchii]|uniref:Uncharacterized protein n=1 Tax=Durusdinium trenchii TaxID=1381693 RepID=A0ABP0I995_9DINO